MTQFRGSVAETKKRVAEAENRVDSKLGGFIGKKYWCALLSGAMPLCTLGLEAQNPSTNARYTC